jgi:hypothetical protein
MGSIKCSGFIDFEVIDIQIIGMGKLSITTKFCGKNIIVDLEILIKGIS